MASASLISVVLLLLGYVVIPVLVLLVLYLVIRKAVRDGILDARRRPELPGDDLTAH